MQDRSIKFITPTREQAAKLAEQERKERLTKVFAQPQVKTHEKEFGKRG
jgi:hypothetical protein